MNPLVIGIPGPWQDHSAVIDAVANASAALGAPRFLVAGGLIMEVATMRSLGFEICEHDPKMAQAFEYAGQGRFTKAELHRIDSHRHTVYLVAGEPFAPPQRENLDGARILLELGVLMLNAGGFAVKVESSGVAHEAERWRHYAEQGTILSLYDAFVMMIKGSEFNYTCGMHTFGLPDTSLTGDIPIERAPYVLNGFNQYQLLESPRFSDGATFAMSLDESALSMSRHEYGYDKDDILNNPYGRWHLELRREPLPKNATKYRAGSQPLFMALRRDDPELMKSVEQARSSLPWFVKNFQSPYEYGNYLVKIHIRDGDEAAYIWATIVDAKDTELTVELFEMPPEFANHKVGQRLPIHADDVHDWCIHRNGTLIGGFSRRFQRKHIPPEERQQFDLYGGIVAFAPLDECL